MKLIVSSDGLEAVNAEEVRNFWISTIDRDEDEEYYPIYADEVLLAYYSSLDDAKKTLKSITTSLTSSLSDVILYLEDGQ